MALIADKAVKTFDLTEISRGVCVRIRRAGDTTFRNGFVTKADEHRIEIIYCNNQNTATSYMHVMAVDVAIGVWEIFWTSDFQFVGHENNAPDIGEVDD